MSNKNSTLKQRTFHHLTAIQRGKIQAMHQDGHSQKAIAKEIGVNQSTVSRELNRGIIQLMNSDRSYRKEYCPEASEQRYLQNRKNCVSKGIYKYSQSFFKELELALKPSKGYRVHSVDTFVHMYHQLHPEERIPCVKTVYHYIDCGLLSIRNIDLPKKVCMRPRKKRSATKGKNIKKLGRSIEERPTIINERLDYGHWELDLVIGKKGKSEPVIITLIERKTRYYITQKVWSSEADIITKKIDQIIQQYPDGVFKTITTDNGSEFAHLSTLETKYNGLNVYFTHAYAAWEKGSNERHNGLLREFIPKGHSLKSLKYQELKAMTDTLNHRPRKILNYQSPQQLFDQSVFNIENVLSHRVI